MLARLFQNSILLMFGQAIQLLVPLIAVPFIARTMSAEDFAVTMATLSVIQFGYIISEYGSSIIGSERFQKAETQDLDVTRDSLLFMRLASACLYFAAALMLFPTMTDNLLVTFISFMALIFFAAQPVWLYNAEEKFVSLTIFTLAGKVTYLALVLILLSGTPYVITVLSCLLIGNAVTAIALSGFPHGRRVSKRPKFDMSEILKVAKGGAEILVSRVFLNFHFFLGTPIVLLFADAMHAATYAAAETIVRAMRGVLGASTQAGFQYVLRARKTSHFLLFLTFVLGTALILGLCINQASDIIHGILYDSKFEGFADYLQLLIMVFVISSLNQVLGYPAFTLVGRRRLTDLTSFILPAATFVTALLLYSDGQDFAKIWVICILVGEFATLFTRVVLLLVIKKHSSGSSGCN